MIDLFLGGDLGLWALSQISVEAVGLVFTLDNEIARYAQNLGLHTICENANDVGYAASPLGLSIHYPKLLKPHILSKYQKSYNLHPGYLPWGRGYYPVFWALWDETPAGATLHVMSEGIDEGPIVSQILVDYFPHDTGGSLHRRVRIAEKELFLEYWPKLVNNEDLPAIEQTQQSGSKHSKKEFMQIKRDVNWRYLTAVDLVKLVRCLSFPGYSGLEITLGDHKFQVHIEPILHK